MFAGISVKMRQRTEEDASGGLGGRRGTDCNPERVRENSPGTLLGGKHSEQENQEKPPNCCLETVLNG